MNEKYQAMLHRAERGELSEAEIDMVAQELQKVKPEANPYTLLHILGESGAKSYQGLVEQFLESQANPSLAALALQILCTYWGETSQYTGQVLQFLRGVPWDRTEDCRLMAASVAGEHLRTHLEPDLLRELLRIYEDAAERQILREAAYLSLARAIGRAYRAIPSAAHEFDLVADIDPAVIQEAKTRLAGTGNR